MADAAATTIRHDTGARHRRKYADRNPFQRLALGRFHDEAAAAIRAMAPKSILDFGCGEALLVEKLADRGVDLSGYVGVDLRGEAIADAKRRRPDLAFAEADIFSWPTDGRRFDLVLASQVMEHLIEPRRYLKRLCSLSRGRLLLTVPLEPWFQLLNLARGRDLARFGNHPEHVNRWSLDGFKEFVSAEASIEKAWAVFPFTFVIARPK